MQKRLILILIIFLAQISCFAGIQKQGSVLSYHHGVVKTKGGSFHIGMLPSYWKQKNIAYRAVLFQNQNDLSTITVDSWCQRAADDAPLTRLTRDLTRGINNFEAVSTYVYNTHGRMALLSEGTGSVDGVSVFVSTYVFQMNTCVFDFIYVTEPEQKEYYQDFLDMIDGFLFVKGPKIL